ncbi:hypothetical protein AJE_06846 [Alishewanella jeotgali KCTC 22429]|uniref:Toxin n=1 Tax=Alishewanella jeotgali KCTC 22429 TaxID=1129374 RepID=H3ZDE4_9ALTE|nr:hypothetical protein AJE_06846 [Alishewanella jeotgali KCTC 22429]
MPDNVPIVVNGWTLFTHPLFAQQYQRLQDKVEALKAKDPQGYIKKNDAKRLAAIYKLAFEIIPQDPTLPDYRQGTTLGGHNKHWFRAKFFSSIGYSFVIILNRKLLFMLGSMMKTANEPTTVSRMLTRCLQRCSSQGIPRMIGMRY